MLFYVSRTLPSTAGLARVLGGISKIPVYELIETTLVSTNKIPLPHWKASE